MEMDIDWIFREDAIEELKSLDSYSQVKMLTSFLKNKDHEERTAALEHALLNDALLEHTQKIMMLKFGQAMSRAAANRKHSIELHRQMLAKQGILK